MKIDLEQSIPQNMSDERCFFKCDEPKGSMLAGILTLFIGIILVPVLVSMVDGTIPVTLNDFLQGLFNEFAKFFNYTISLEIGDYVLYMAFSTIAGIVAIKPLKALGMPLAFIGINLLGFFFLALFYLGIAIDYDLFFAGMVRSLLVLLIGVVAPCLVGVMLSRVIVSRKKCFVMGKGTTVTQ